MKVGLIDFDSKHPNLALMQLSSWHKAQGDDVVLNPLPLDMVDHAYISVLFTWNRDQAAELAAQYPSVTVGGTGWSADFKLPEEVAVMKPDYDLYSIRDLYPRIAGCRSAKTRERKAKELINSGIGKSSTGCVRSCPFCIVPKAEGAFKSASEIRDLLNPRSNLLTLLDANLTADPNCISKLHEIRDRALVLNLTQGCDYRLMTPEIAQALSEVKMYGSERMINGSWDLMGAEKSVIRGIEMLKQVVPARRLRVYMLAGFNTTWTEDIYRFRKIRELGAIPYVMIYDKQDQKRFGQLDLRLFHFARWANNPRLFKACDFNEYEPWQKVRERYFGGETFVPA